MLEKGDKIKWINPHMPHNVIYKVIEIDRTRPAQIVPTPNNPRQPYFEIKNEILLEWEMFGSTYSTWAYDYDSINKAIGEGKVIIVEKHNYGTPLREIRKLKI